ncbi:MAG: zf-HC2 domain-containing protein [Actinobacteria bacterium]|nr:zf-HC2 domain-containing protein [Actinomycetota bacterium]
MSTEAPLDDELIGAYLDGELPPTEAARVRARIAASAEAQRALAELQAVARLLRMAPAPAPPRDYRRVVPAPSRWERAFRWSPALATAAAVALIVVGLVNIVGSGTRISPAAAVPGPPHVPSVALRGEAEAAPAAAPSPGRADAGTSVAQAVADTPVTVETQAATERMAAAPAGLSAAGVPATPEPAPPPAAPDIATERATSSVVPATPPDLKVASPAMETPTVAAPVAASPDRWPVLFGVAGALLVTAAVTWLIRRSR